MNKNQTITIAIPTCYGGESLVQTVETIIVASNNLPVEILIQADRTPLTQSVRERLRKLGARVSWNSVEGSQFKKLKQLIEKATGDIFIFTQDDITFDAHTIQEIKEAFLQNKQLTMVGSRILPLPPTTFFEKSMAVMVRIVDKVAGYWDNGDNYLAASGRCMAFRTNHLKKFRIPENLVNGDMFLYLENKRLEGTFLRLRNALVFIRCPQKLSDQLGPSSRFQFSQTELQKYFSFPIGAEYRIPRSLLLKAVMREFHDHTGATFFYLLIFLYTRLKRQSNQTVSNPIWKVDTSTKKS